MEHLGRQVPFIVTGDPGYRGVDKKGVFSVDGAPKREGGGNACLPRALPRTTMDGQAPTMHTPAASGCFFEGKGGEIRKRLTLRQGSKITGKTEGD